MRNDVQYINDEIDIALSPFIGDIMGYSTTSKMEDAIRGVLDRMLEEGIIMSPTTGMKLETMIDINRRTGKVSIEAELKRKLKNHR